MFGVLGFLPGYVIASILKYFDMLRIAGRKKRKKFKKEKFLYYTSWKNMIDELKPDLVVIGVPPKAVSYTHLTLPTNREV